MKLNHDLVRSLLLSIESSDDPNGFSPREVNEFIENNDFSENDIGYAVNKLNEAGFITGKATISGDNYYIIYPGNLTYDGHEFLDNIRDDGVWKDTKEIASKFSSVSASFLSKIAVGVISEIIKKQIGL